MSDFYIGCVLGFVVGVLTGVAAGVSAAITAIWRFFKQEPSGRITIEQEQDDPTGSDAGVRTES
jgi:hypothetical protein